MASSLAAQVCRRFGECEDAWPKDWLNSISPSRSLPREIIQLRSSLNADFVPTRIEYESTVKRMFLEIVDTEQEYTKRKLFGLAAEEEKFRSNLMLINVEYDRSYFEILSNLLTDLDTVSGALVAGQSGKTYQNAYLRSLKIGHFLKQVDPLLISLRIHLKKLVRLKDDICGHRSTDPLLENNTILHLPDGLATFSGHANSVYRMLQERIACNKQEDHLTHVPLLGSAPDTFELLIIFQHKVTAYGDITQNCIPRTVRISQSEDGTSSSGQSQLNAASSWLPAPEAIGQGNVDIEERFPIKNICVHLIDEQMLEGVLQDSNDSYSVKVASPGKGAGASATPGPRMATLESVLAHSLHPQPRLAEKYVIASCIASWHIRLYHSQWHGSHWNSKDIQFAEREGRTHFSQPYLAKYLENDDSGASTGTADQPAQSLGAILSRLFPVRSSREPHKPGTLLSRLLGRLAWPTIPSDRESRHAINEVLSEIESDYGSGLGSALRWCLETRTSDANDLSWRAAMHAKVVEPLKALAEITSTAMRTTEFDLIADQLKDALKRSTTVCAGPFQQTPTHRFDFEVGFCPRGALESLVRRHEDLLKILYMQTARSSVSEGSMSHDSDLRKATEANSFFTGLMKRPHFWQVLASLIYSKTTPSSKMWLATWSRFTSACRNVQEHFEIFTEKSLPFNNAHLKTLFHESSTDIVLFRTMQYMFCAATLEQDCQLDYNLKHERPIRLPLLVKEPIGSPSSEGVVFKVKISAGHFRAKDGLNGIPKDMAMKVLTISPWIQDEWKWTSLLLQQDLIHKSVMRAQSSIRIQSKVFIFYELAAGDLNQFITKLETKPPRSSEEKRYMFHQMVKVAKALEFLHKSFRSRDEARMSLFHKDIKLENILVTYEDDLQTGQRRPVFKITDFGLSSVQYDTVSTFQAPSSNSIHSPRRVLVQTRGDPYFPNAAPEARIGDGLVGAASDVWAFGTVLAQYLAWMYGGNEALKDLRARLLKDYSDMTFFRVIRPPENSNSSGAPQSSKGADEEVSLTADIAQEYAVVKEQALVWFDNRMTGHSELSNGTGTLSADPTRLQDTLFAACWKLLRDKVLICDHRHRTQIEDVCEELSRIQQALGAGKKSS